MSTITVFVVEDHPLMRSGVKHALSRESDIRVVGVAGSAAEAMERIGELAPDVVLIDIRLPDSDGVSLLTNVKQTHPGARVIMLSVSSDDDYVKGAIERGAHGYLLKDIGVGRLVGAIRQVAGGLNVFSPEITSRILVIGENDDSAKPWASLTSREREIWRLLALGTPNHEVAENLVITQSTIKFHTRNLFQKLGVRNKAEAASLAFKCGFLAERSPSLRAVPEEV